MTKSTEQEVDIAVLKEQVKTIDENVSKIMDNHLPHLKDQIDSINLKIAYWMGGVGVVLAILQLILKFYFN